MPDSPMVLPPETGIGLKPAHYRDVLEPQNGRATPAWVEVHPQNYFVDGGPPHRWLSAVAERYPLSFHSVGLSIGTAQGLSQYAPLFFQRLPAQQRQTLLQRRAQNRLGRLDKARCELVKQSTNFFGSANQQFAVLLCRTTFLRDTHLPPIAALRAAEIGRAHV